MIGIQIENELYDQPEHIATLKQLARDAGLSAPLWTATGWGGAVLPPHEVFPLYSGYADGFWAGQGSTWDDSFRDHFRFTHVWDDPGVGGDFREEGVEIVVRDIDPEFPPATCELGGGMATAYHRRPIARGRDIAALANVKIGNGSAWQGFYMYVGGTNPADHLQETHATGYPNDLPRFDYDFQAAFGATGHPGAESRSAARSQRVPRRLRRSAGADVQLAARRRAGRRARPGRRCAGQCAATATAASSSSTRISRTSRSSGSADVQFRIALGGEDVVVPDRPIDIPSGLIARWPLRLDLAGVRIEWATASVAGVVEGAIPTLVLRAHDGVAARVQFAAGTGIRSGAGEDVSLMSRWTSSRARLCSRTAPCAMLVVDERQAERLWYLGEELIDSVDAVWREPDGLVAARCAAARPRPAGRGSGSSRSTSARRPLRVRSR